MKYNIAVIQRGFKAYEFKFKIISSKNLQKGEKRLSLPVYIHIWRVNLDQGFSIEDASSLDLDMSER